MKISVLNLVALLLITIPNFASAKTQQTTQPRNIEKLSDGSIYLGSIFPYHGLTDPHSWVENGRVYVMCGHDESWKTYDTWRMNRWEMWSSSDLMNWKYELNILPTQTYIGDKPNCWAGDLTKRNGKYYWFFSNAFHDIGVMEADKINGNYTDILGKPLLSENIIPGKVYDPEIYVENGVYTICFGAGKYYMATLSPDMKSIVAKPKPVIVTKNGKEVWTADKSSLFKHGDWYYLLYGSRYAMSKNLYGPYEEQENKLPGGHNNIFEFKGHLYLMHEFTELYLFYRGVGLNPLYVANDGKLSVYTSKKNLTNNPFNLDYSKTGWDADYGTTEDYSKNGYIYGTITKKDAYISSCAHLGIDVAKTKAIEFDLRNQTNAKKLRIAISTLDYTTPNWWNAARPIDWNSCKYVDVNIESNSKTFKTVHVDLSQFGDLEHGIRQVRIYPALGVSKGKWAIDNINFK